MKMNSKKKAAAAAAAAAAKDVIMADEVAAAPAAPQKPWPPLCIALGSLLVPPGSIFLALLIMFGAATIWCSISLLDDSYGWPPHMDARLMWLFSGFSAASSGMAAGVLMVCKTFFAGYERGEKEKIKIEAMM